MKRVMWIAGAAVFAAACSGGAKHEAAAEPAPVAAATAPIEMRELVERSEAGGIVRARTTAVVAARLMAPVLDVKVRPGDRVRKGDVLVVLDARDLRAQRARGAAEFSAAEQGVRAAEANQKAAEAALALAKATFDRISGLHAKKSATAQELDEATAGLRGADERVAAARAQVEQASASLKAAQAGSDATAVAASWGELTAPFNGIVTERNVDPGSTAAPGAPLLLLEDPAAYRAEVRVDEARAGAIKVGDTVEVVLGDSASKADAQVAGRVVEIGRTMDPAAHTFLVKVDLPEHAAVRSGLFARVRFGGAGRRALTAPASSVVSRGQLTFVYALDGERRARLRPVRIGASDADRIEILAGADAGESVVLSPAVTLVDGARVTAAGDRR